MTCPICEKRPAKRFCPAKGEKICAICCGREREVTIDCPPTCAHLVTAHRYEAEHRNLTPREEFPYRDIEFPVEFVYDRWPVVAGLAGTINAFQTQNKELNDATTQQRASRSKHSRKRIAHSAQESTTSGRLTRRWLAPYTRRSQASFRNSASSKSIAPDFPL